MKVGVAVGDEALHSVQAPAFGSLVPCRLQSDGLQVAAGVRLGEIHRAGGTLPDTRQVFLFQLVAAELLDGVGAVGKAPDGGEADIGAGNHLGHHYDSRTREVKSVVLAVERYTVEPGLDEGVEVAACAGSILHAASFELRTHVIYFLCIGSNHVASDFTKQIHQHIVLLHSLLGICRRFRVLSGLGKILFLYGHHLFHLRMVEIE